MGQQQSSSVNPTVYPASRTPRKAGLANATNSPARSSRKSNTTTPVAAPTPVKPKLELLDLSALHGVDEYEPLEAICPPTPTPRSKTLHTIIAGGEAFDIDLATLGSGSFAAVHVGFRCSTGERVAIKRVDKNGPNRATQYADLEREKAVLSKSTHPYVVKMYGCAEDAAAHYMVMEFIEGEDMQSYVSGKGRLSETEAAKWFLMACEAVHYLHTIGFAHRDLKLDNLMLDRVHGCIKVVDFGFAAPLTSDKFVDFPGTAPYASPQLISGIPYDGRMSDVWSLGVVLFAMLVGRYPFWDKEQPVLVRQILTMEPDFSSAPGITSSARHLVMSMLEKNVMRRLSMDSVRRHPWMRAASIDTPARSPIVRPRPSSEVTSAVATPATDTSARRSAAPSSASRSGGAGARTPVARPPQRALRFDH